MRYILYIGSATRQRSEMNTSTYQSKTMTQETRTHADFPSRTALLTRFAGSRRWAVVGKEPASSFGGERTVHCHNGPRDWFSRSDAVEMAERFVTRGWDFL